MARCGACSKVIACVGCLSLIGAIVIFAWPIYSLGFQTPTFAVEGGTVFKLDLTQHMSEKNCSFLLLRTGTRDEDPCRSANVSVTPPGIAGLSGLEWTSIDKLPACQVDVMFWMEQFHPRLEFLGTLVPISTTYTDDAPRVGEYHVQSEEPLWALNQCDNPLYAYFPLGAGGALLIFFVVAAILGTAAVLACCCALLMCCCCGQSEGYKY
eukprot:CAMPEP_0115305442 /NCGR_PEP_ID=MMETSP0270-20121206/72028_1 /TAXON_ID=71861 /ORGANISM="Scrippsiella trochoidea, Strain CCMP3099" /LENGTH=209 /DNA_ID=CAMNT_0002723655 /DNA_START=76 /DNA_END=705 /DNA_ORIENTATION=-